MALSTKNVKTEEAGGGLKTITPGQHKLKINSIELKRFSFMEQDQGYYFIMNVETEPIDGFEGFMIDVNDPSKGNYAGKVGQVKANKFFYKDGTTKGGIEIYRDTELMKQIKKICLATNQAEWFEKADGKYDTIEAMVDGFNNDAPFKDVFLNITVAGKEYQKANGHIGYDMFLPKLSKGLVAMEAADAKLSKIMPFNEADHWSKYVAEPVAEFGDAGEVTPDLSGAPDFEL
jgi:hypothetical protein